MFSGIFLILSFVGGFTLVSAGGEFRGFFYYLDYEFGVVLTALGNLLEMCGGA